MIFLILHSGKDHEDLTLLGLMNFLRGSSIVSVKMQLTVYAAIFSKQVLEIKEAVSLLLT